MIKIKNYEVVRASDINELKNEVKSCLEKGLQPIGGIAVECAFDTDGKARKHFYLQAMVAHSDE